MSAIGGLIQWLYSKSYTLSAKDTKENANERFWQLARLNTLADKYDMPALTNNIIDRLLDNNPANRRSGQVFYGPRLEVISYIYENTTEKSSFRKFIVAWYSWGLDIAWYDKTDTREQLLGVHHDFMVDVAMALGQRLAFPGRTNPFTLPRSAYYEDEKSGRSEDKIAK